jgi:hypothetical protein
MLNKQPSDPDVAGIGQFVEQNFFNIGIGDHPVQALNALARGRIDFGKLGPDGYPYHAEDTGREEITLNADDKFKFRAVTLRQLKDARTFFHNGSFTKLRDVVQYFNAGIPQDPTAGAASTLSKRFTHPRGNGTPQGLGLSDRQVDDLTDFLDNALYDPAFAKYDPHSTTDTLQPNERDLAYSKHRPGLVALGAKDGVLLSGLGVANNDPLSRRDQGLEFLDVSQQAHVSIQSDRRSDHGRRDDVVRITNNSLRGIDTHLLVIVQGLSGQARLVNASGTTSNGEPYLRVFLPNGELQPGQSVVRMLSFEPRGDRDQRRGPPDQAVRYSVRLLSGQGNP